MINIVICWWTALTWAGPGAGAVRGGISAVLVSLAWRLWEWRAARGRSLQLSSATDCLSWAPAPACRLTRTLTTQETRITHNTAHTDQFIVLRSVRKSVRQHRKPLTSDIYRSTDAVISSTAIFVAIDNNTLYGSNNTFFYYDKNH